MNYLNNKPDIIDFQVFEDRIEVTKRERSNSIYCSGNPVPDKVWKEVYRVSFDGRIFLSETIQGKHIPSTINDEHFEFEDGIK
jgi:hypothetical protein